MEGTKTDGDIDKTQCVPFAFQKSLISDIPIRVFAVRRHTTSCSLR